MGKFLIVGLGNPGKEYENTRHNIGFKVVDNLSKKFGLEFKSKIRLKSQIAKGEIQKDLVYLQKPMTYMNDSGAAVKKAIDYFKVDLDKLLIVVDDADIEEGEFRLKEKGSSGGHRGLKSIEELIGDEYPRLRVGIGRGREKLKSYVLDRFKDDETLKDLVNKATSNVEIFLQKEFAIAASEINVRIKKNTGETKA